MSRGDIIMVVATPASDPSMPEEFRVLSGTDDQIDLRMSYMLRSVEPTDEATAVATAWKMLSAMVASGHHPEYGIAFTRLSMSVDQIMRRETIQVLTG